jgi:hypothetical protein
MDPFGAECKLILNLAVRTNWSQQFSRSNPTPSCVMRIQDTIGFTCINGHSDLFWAENSNLNEIDPGTASRYKRRTDRCDENVSSKYGCARASPKSNGTISERMPLWDRDVRRHKRRGVLNPADAN